MSLACLRIHRLCEDIRRCVLRVRVLIIECARVCELTVIQFTLGAQIHAFVPKYTHLFFVFFAMIQHDFPHTTIQTIFLFCCVELFALWPSTLLHACIAAVCIMSMLSQHHLQKTQSTLLLLLHWVRMIYRKGCIHGVQNHALLHMEKLSVGKSQANIN